MLIGIKGKNWLSIYDVYHDVGGELDVFAGEIEDKQREI